jgi:UDP-2-acetamido-3-amino-2,3-dideoxy-glucuronate N-acetyltransferase
MIHRTADVSPEARVGPETKVWHEAQVREGAVLGANCTVGKGAYIGPGVLIGDRVKIQNRASLYPRLTLEDGVFVGPHACFANDKYPRSITAEGRLLTDEDWTPGETLVREGASIGAGAVVLPGVTIGRWAMVGASALVTADVPDHGLVLGSPARLVGYACDCGRRLERAEGAERWRCPHCGREFHLTAAAVGST